MSGTAWNLLVWGSFGLGFFVREVPALFGRSPWLTLSDVLWDVQADWRPAAALLGISIGWLAAHILGRFVL